MYVAGIDMGAKYVKVVVLDDGQIKSKSISLSGFNLTESAERTFNDALESGGISKDEIKHITSTGVGKKEVPFRNDEITQVGAAAKGATFLFPNSRTIIEVGAEEGKALRCDERGRVMDFVVNEKCAAGAGAFTEAMSRALEIPLEEMGPLSLKSENAVPMNAQCAVFAESEVVTLVHAKTAKQDIARAIHDAMASRISSMTRRLSIEKDVALIGGLARNVGFVESLKRDLNMDLLVPEDPDYVGALGAALAARERAEGG
ncbi:MAG: CoA activase [Methanomassiliicoccales archaeon]|nr:MAG: CoA activase [Methanomassiliicoccales archaeon]